MVDLEIACLSYTCNKFAFSPMQYRKHFTLEVVNIQLNAVYDT